MAKRKYQDVFRRYEKKYMLSAAQYTALRQRLASRMQEDEYGQHTICNLYFDTEDFTLIRHSLDKPTYKEKLRLRSYGIPDARDTVFIELKKKVRGVVYKRRVGMPLCEAYRYLLSGLRPAADCQILREIDWFQRQYEVRPRAFIGYDRIALFGKEDPALRITFDTAVRGRADRLDLTLGDQGALFMQQGARLMEIKIGEAMPVWLSRTLSACEIFPASFSKYGAYYQNYLLSARKEGVVCA